MESRDSGLASNKEIKQVYSNYLEYYVNTIEDESIKRFVLNGLRSAPRYIWTKSIDSEKTPEDEKQTHGLIRRIAKGCYYAKQLCNDWELQDCHDIIVAAALLHELKKFDAVSRVQHGPFTADWLDEVAEETNLPENEEIREVVNVIIDVVRKHDGRKWVIKSGLEAKVPEIWKEQSRVDMIAWLIHTADFIASRRLTEFVWAE
jgi:hypothetical protein